MIKRNYIWHFFLLVGFVLTLSACSKGDSSNSNDNLKVWTMSDGMDEFVETYEKENDVTVDVQTIPWSNAHDKLLTALASGKGPDVIQIGNTWVSEFAEAGTFLDLSEYIDEYENFDPDNFFEAAIDTTEFDNEIIGIPWYVDTRLLYYRSDLLGDMGYPDGPETWDDMIDISEQLVAQGDDHYAIDLPKEGRYPFIMSWQRDWDYDVDRGSENFDAPEFKEALALYELFYEEGYSQVEEGKELVQAFSDGTKPMFFSGPWDMKTIKDDAPELDGKWDVSLMPKAENAFSEMGGAHLGIFHNSDKVDEALDFINWMADPETQVAWYEHFSELPANQIAWDDPVLSDDPKASVFEEQLEQTKAIPLIPEYEKLSNDLADSLESIFRGGVDLDEAIEEYKETVDRTFKED